MFLREYFLSVHTHNLKEHLQVFVWELSEEHFPILAPPFYSFQWQEMPVNPFWSEVGEWQCVTSQISPAIPAVALATHHLHFCQSQQWIIFKGTMLPMELKKSEKAGTSVCFSLVNPSFVSLIYRHQLEDLSRKTGYSSPPHFDFVQKEQDICSPSSHSNPIPCNQGEHFQF